jgi:hypothetical protein
MMGSFLRRAGVLSAVAAAVLALGANAQAQSGIAPIRADNLSVAPVGHRSINGAYRTVVVIFAGESVAEV